jgi:hypothetical protein
MTSAAQQLHETWVFFLQGFHFHQHKFQTIVTFFLSLGFAGWLGALMHQLWERFTKWVQRPALAEISVEEWRSFIDLVNGASTLADGAGKLSLAASNTAKAAEAMATKAGQDNDTVAASVNNVNGRLDLVDGAITGLRAQVQRLEMSPVPQLDSQGAVVPADFKMFQLEVSNTLDELREEIRLFKEDIDGRVLMVEFETSESKAGDEVLAKGLEAIHESTLGFNIEDQVAVAPKRGRGRPLGSKNKVSKKRKKK